MKLMESVGIAQRMTFSQVAKRRDNKDIKEMLVKLQADKGYMVASGSDLFSDSADNKRHIWGISRNIFSKKLQWVPIY